MSSPATIDLVDHLANSAWFSFCQQLATGNNQPALPDSLPSRTITRIQTLYSNLIKAPVSAIADPNLNIITFTRYSGATSTASMPTVASPASVSSTHARDRKSRAKVPRPPNAFILYRQHQHPLIKAQYPGIVNNDISKKVAALWKDESEEVKATWKAKADEAKEQHLQQNPGYSYQPRKPSEKKRRMTKRKMAAMSAAVAVDNNAQQVQTPQQQPLPNFTVSPGNPNMLSIDLSTLGDTSIAAIDNLGLMIDQHNNSGQSLVDHTNNPFVELRSDEAHAAENDIVPQYELNLLMEYLDDGSESAPVDGAWWEAMDNDGNMMDADRINNQQFLNSADAKDLEQERQEKMFEECFEWGLFGESVHFPQ